MGYVLPKCDAVLGLKLAVYFYVCAYMHEVMGVSLVCICVSVCLRGWRCVKVMLTVHTQTAPEENASLVDPLCMLCVRALGLGSCQGGVFA